MYIKHKELLVFGKEFIYERGSFKMIVQNAGGSNIIGSTLKANND